MILSPRHTVVLALFLWSALCCRAQDPYSFTISEGEGLPSKDVYDLFQDSRGFIWVTTNAGLSRYDGHSFVTFTSAEQSSRPGANIFEDPVGRIWYENFDGYYYYVMDDSLHAFTGSSSYGWTRGVVAGELLVIPATNSLNLYDIRTLAFRKSILKNRSEGTSLTLSGDKAYWYNNSRIYTVDGQGNADSLMLPVLASGESFAEVYNWKGKIILVGPGTPAPVLRTLENNTLKPFSPLPPFPFLQKHELEDGKIWLCASKGVWVVDAETGELLENRAIFADKSISAILVDKDRNHWFGTLGQGLILVPDFNSRLISTGNVPLTRLVTDGNELFCGSQDGKVSRVDKNSIVPFYTSSTAHSIDLLQYDSLTGLIFAGKPEMISLRPDGSNSLVVNGAVKQVVRVTDRYLVSAISQMTTLIRMPGAGGNQPDPWDSIFTRSSLTNDSISRSLLTGRCRSVARNLLTGMVYAGTGEGLFTVTPKGCSEITYVGKPLFVSSLEPWGSIVYALTTQGELFVINADHSLRRINDLPVQGPYIRLFITGGRMYLLGDRSCAQLSLGTGDPQLMRVIPGIDSRSVNDMLQFGDRVALATGTGLLLLNPDQQVTATPPRLIITGLLISGRKHRADTLAVVSSRENDVQIDYSILSFSTGGNFPLWYSINEGVWEQARTSERSLRLARLAPGDYDIRFCLGAPCEETAAEVHIRISKPWWMQAWFYIALALGFILVILLIIRWRWQAIRKRHRRSMERMELENDMRQSRLSAIRSQMNPHFFFNALNTLQALIYTEDKKQAANYLSKFSKLTRLVLEMSDRERVLLAEEIQALTLYLEIEQARFEEDFHFSFQVDKAIRPEDIQIPSMIIQPFVENAVKHGLLHKKGNKELIISFAVQHDKLIIRVEDNGIGRKRSAELNQVRKEKHRSFSSTATARRVELLNTEGRKNSVEYIDKTGAGGEPTGTVVVIALHILKPIHA